MNFQQTNCIDFAFEDIYPSEENEDYRLIYVEVQK